MIMMKQQLLTLALFAALFIVAPTLTAAQTPTSPCLRTFREIFNYEDALDDEGTLTFRTYTICPNTLLEPGIPDVNGQILDDDLPLSCKENCLVRCGTSGSSSNNCKIDGTGPLAVYQIPLFIFDNLPDSSENVIFQGFTLDFFVNDQQRPIIMGSAFGDVTFIDWIFSNNNADPFFVIQQLSYPGYEIRNSRAAGRSANIDNGADNVFGRSTNSTTTTDSTSTTPTTIPRGYIHPDKFTARMSATGGGGGRGQRPRRRMVEDANLLDIRTPEERDAIRRESYADKYIDAILMPDEREEERRLQAVTSIYRVSFVDCLFDFNAPVLLAETQFGLSVVRVSGADIFYLFGLGNRGPEDVDMVGNMDVRLVRNEFVDNIYSLGDDRATYRSLIDFYSTGRLTMRQNCFIRSPVQTFGVVTVNTDGTVVNTRNFLDKVQPDLNCPFVAYLTDEYTLQSCGPRATAVSCRANVATSAPSAAPGAGSNSGGGGFGGGGFCFPGDATVHVLPGGAAAKSVQMKDLKVGDKVLVADGKYEAIYSFGHYAQGSEAEYVKLGMDDGKSIELSRDHMLFVQGGHVVPASTIQIGDQVALGGNGEEEQSYTSVTTIAMTRKREGAFAPFTASGSVVVNGIKASSFVAFQDSETLGIGGGDNRHVLFDTGLTFQFLAHTFEGPHRTWCQYVSSCTEERYTAEGISTWVAFPYKLFVWFHAQNTFTMAVMMVPISILFGVLANPAVVLAIMLGTALLRSTTMRIKRT